MPRTKQKSAPKKQSRIRRAAATVARVLTRGKKKAAPKAKTATAEPKKRTRPARPQTDIPIDQLEKAYMPTQTSMKAGFRESGADHQRDQEFAKGAADTRWNDEDRLTNKSGDPRIGTHGRTYEPGEKRKK
jgi:hypothetical protein